MTPERARELINYDPNTGEFRWRVYRSWNSREGDLAGRVDGRGYLQIALDSRRYLAHRLAWFITHNEWPLHEIDHINGDRLDNRLANLRAVSRAQNMRNKARYRNSSRPMHGVAERSGRWRVVIGDRHIGTYGTAEAAIAARRAAEAAHGYNANHGGR